MAKFPAGTRVVIRTKTGPINHGFNGERVMVDYNGLTGIIDEHGSIKPDKSRWGASKDWGFYWDDHEVFAVPVDPEEVLESLRQAVFTARAAGHNVECKVTTEVVADL